MGQADTLMSAQVSARDMAAISIGTGIWIPVMLAMGGLLMALTPVVAGHHGADEPEQVAPWFSQALWLALPVGLLAAWLLRQSAPLLDWLQVAQELREPALAYLNYTSWGMPAFAIFQVFRCCADGLSHPKAGMWINFLGLGCCIPLNWVFIYGHFGAPALGGPGCGIATSLTFLLMAVAMISYVLCSRHLSVFELHRIDWRPHWPRLQRLLRLGTPIALSIFIEVSLFTLTSVLLGRLGVTAVAAHQIALGLSSLVFMMPLSVGFALCIRIGYLRGEGQSRRLGLACKAAFGLALVQALVSCGLTFMLAPDIARLYSQDVAVLAVAVPLIYLAGLYQIPDALQIVASGALRGFRDTLVSMLISLVSFWGVGMGLGYSLALTSFWGPPLGPQGMWIGICIGLCVAAMLFGVRLRSRLRREVGGQ